MNCSNCGKEVYPEWKVCPFCTQPLAAIVKCGKCGAELKPDWKACPKCGTLISVPEKSTTGEKASILENDHPQVGSRKNIEVKGAVFGFCWIPPGQFRMGSTVRPDEQPVHKVKITRGFWLGRTQVTQGQWQAVMGSNPSYFPKGDDHPVEQVSWDDCQEFIGKLNRLTGGNFRLPTEAEWEYACHAGVSREQSVDYFSVAWFWKNSNRTTHPVAQKLPNAWGLYDMFGNVWEWCQDRYGGDYYTNSPAKNPTGPEKGSYRVFRGGCYNDDVGYLRCAYRNYYEPDYSCNRYGFRLALGSAGG